MTEFFLTIGVLVGIWVAMILLYWMLERLFWAMNVSNSDTVSVVTVLMTLTGLLAILLVNIIF